TYATTGPNLTREWPGATFGPRADCTGTPNGPGSAADATDHLTSACSNGNGALADKVNATDGSIGYGDLATERSKGFTMDGTAALTKPYWIPGPNGSGAYTEPTSDPLSYQASNNTKGSNCGSSVITGTPASAYGDWSQTSATNTNNATAWGICTLTYGLVFDD